jgi:hypothetical protein
MPSLAEGVIWSLDYSNNRSCKVGYPVTEPIGCGTIGCEQLGLLGSAACLSSLTKGSTGIGDTACGG